MNCFYFYFNVAYHMATSGALHAKNAISKVLLVYDTCSCIIEFIDHVKHVNSTRIRVYVCGKPLHDI